jgi:hypothetical protein
MLMLPFVLSALAIAQLPSASDHPPIFPGRMFPTDLGKLRYGIADVAVADMDQDGHLDVLVLRGAPETAVSLLRGDGRGNLRCTGTLAAPAGGTGSTGQLAILDVDGDGNLDAVASGSAVPSGGILHVFHGDGAGTLASHSIVRISGTAGRMEVADMDRDGLLDLVALVKGGLSILLRQPTGGFASEALYASPIERLGVGDLDSDSFPDVATASSGTWVWLFSNAGDGSLLPHRTLPDTLSTRGLELADLNGDGTLDLLRSVVLATNESKLCVHLGDGDGHFAQPLEESIGSSVLIGVRRLPPGHGVALIRDEALAASVALERGQLTEPAPFLSANHAIEFELADMDEDGVLDWLTGAVQGDLHAAVGVFLGDNDGTLQGVFVSPSSAGLPIVRFADFDADGNLDAIGADWVQPLVTIHMGRPGGRFLPASVVRGWFNDPRPLPGDFDGDGLLDLAVISQVPPSISLMRGDGLGGFGQPETFYTKLTWDPSGGWPIAADVDGDGNDEAVVSVPVDGAMSVFGVVDGRFRVEAMLDATGAIGPLFARDLAGSVAPDVLYLRRGPVAPCALWGLALDSNGTWQPAFPWMDLPLSWMPGLFGVVHTPWKDYLHLCDVDGDPHLDVIAHRTIYREGFPGPTPAGTQLEIWRSTPGNGWSLSASSRLEGRVYESKPLDLDGDGTVELVLDQLNQNPVQYGRALVVLGLAEGRIVGEPDRYPLNLPLADVNGDGLFDVVSATSKGLVTFLNLTGARR